MGHPSNLEIVRLGRWYINPEGVRFMCCEPPRKAFEQDLWVGPVLLSDGRVVNSYWGAECRRWYPWPARWFVALWQILFPRRRRTIQFPTQLVGEPVQKPAASSPEVPS